MLSTFPIPTPRADAVSRRVMRLTATAELLIQMCKASPEGYWWRLSASPLPDDARLVDVRYDPDCRCVVMTLESAEWPELLPGSHMLEVNTPQFESVNLGARS